MSADLHIHIITPEITEQVLRDFFQGSIGSKWGIPDEDGILTYDPKPWEETRYAYDIVANSPSIWIGQVSWLKAAFFEQGERYVPDTILSISDAIGEDLPVLDDELLDKIMAAFDLPNKSIYQEKDGFRSLAKPADVRRFLEEHKGKRLFTVSW